MPPRRRQPHHSNSSSAAVEIHLRPKSPPLESDLLAHTVTESRADPLRQKPTSIHFLSRGGKPPISSVQFSSVLGFLGVADCGGGVAACVRVLLPVGVHTSMFRCVIGGMYDGAVLCWRVCRVVSGEKRLSPPFTDCPCLPWC
jgi:hypothetical protein